MSLRENLELRGFVYMLREPPHQRLPFFIYFLLLDTFLLALFLKFYLLCF